MLALWYSLRGYVKIRTRGFSAERFINMVTFRGVPLWDISCEGACMTMKAAGNSREILETCAEKTGCSLEFIGMGGLPVFLRRFRRKEVWTVGMFLFAAGLYLLSSFVWTVEVEGNERLEKEAILSACQTMGLCPGAWKGSVDTEKVTEGLLAQFTDIAWVSVGIEGTDASVKLAETIEQTEPVDKVTPCDVVASADGIIVQITVERGTPKVQAGDVVRKGDVLISSELVIGLEGEEQRTEYTAAEGLVIARTWQKLTEEMLFSYEEAVYSGVEKENGSIIFFEKELDIIRPDGVGQWEKVMDGEYSLELGDFCLPVRFRKEIWKQYEMMTRERTAEETKLLLEETLRQKTENLLSSEGEIEDFRITYEEYTDRIRAEAEVTRLERIDEKRKNEKRERENLNEF